jgi:anti-anti-sigma factor
MNIERRTVGDVLVLSIRGDITMNDSGASRVADRVRSAVQEGHTRLVRYVDSAGLGDLVQAYTAARNRGATVKLINVTKRLHDLLAVTKLLPVFDRFDQESDALASFEQDAGRQPRQVLRCA